MKTYKGEVDIKRKHPEKDYLLREIDFGSQNWLTRKQAEKCMKNVTIRDQKSTSSCVCFATCVALEHTEKEILSPAYLYSQRMNKPQEGSYYHNIGDIVSTQGVATEKQLPTPTKEILINNVKIPDEIKREASLFRQNSYAIEYSPSIDLIKDIVNSNDRVVISVWATFKEWGKEYPTVDDTTLTQQKAPIRHAVTVLENSAFIENGKKYVIIHDSAKFGKKTFRYLSEDFISQRCALVQNFFDYYLLDIPPAKKDLELPDHLKYTFTRDLGVGSTGGDVKKLQEILKYLGFFPDINTTGLYAGITRQAVKEFQEEYKTEILLKLGLKNGTGNFYKSTREFLNRLMVK